MTVRCVLNIACCIVNPNKVLKTDTRLTVLKKVEGKYKWNGALIPVPFIDAKTFEDLNQICINIWGISENSEAHPLRLGTIPYVKADTLNLLLLHGR